MKFGRRAQQAALGIAGLVGLGTLHLMVFSPSSTAYQLSLKARADAELRIQTVKSIRNPADLKKLDKISEDLEKFYEEARNSLNLTYNLAFLPANEASIPSITPNMPEDAKARILAEVNAEKEAKQLELVLAEISELLEKEAEQNELPEEDRTVLSFLREGLGPETGTGGWKLPPQLPDEFARRPGMEDNEKSAALQDVLLKEIKETLLLMESISADNVELREQQRVNYENALRRIGIENNTYRDVEPLVSLAAHGPYASLINKMQYAELLLARASDPAKDITRGSLYRWLEISPPYGRLGDMPVGEIYFMYESLRYLNDTIEMMIEHDIDEVFRVKIENPRFLVEKNELGFAGPQSYQSRTIDAPVPSPFVLNYDNDPLLEERPSYSIRTANPPPGGSDLGYALTIRYQFTAPNTQGWKLLYDVIGRFPLSELDELKIEEDPTGNGVLVWDAQIIYVPFLFTVQGNEAKEEVDDEATEDGATEDGEEASEGEGAEDAPADDATPAAADGSLTPGLN